MIPQDNPFPGMNPWLQNHWSDVHFMLVSYLRDAVSPELPPDLNARVEERIALETTDSDETVSRADVAIVESWRSGFPPLWQPEDDQLSIAVAEPLLVEPETTTERWIEIRNLTGKVITVIEVLSPTNKKSDGWLDYQRKMRDCLDAGVNLVEIDLLRGGRHAVQVPKVRLEAVEGTHGIICVTRAAPRRRHEVYRWPLRERIPAFRIPLRTTDSDIPLDLQPLVNRCHKMGRYWQSTGREELRPPLPKGDAAWADGVLKQALAAE
jgi:hypothetical protein